MLKLNIPNSDFRKIGSNLYVSELIDIKSDGSGTVHKPMLDYGSMEPKKIPYVYDTGDHMFHVHRFMKYSHLQDSLNKGGISLCFVSPKEWPDPFEQLLYDEQKPLVCMCCTYERTEAEEAGWNRSNNGNEPYVRVSYNYSKMCELLQDYGKRNNISFYITIADYCNSIEQILGARNKVIKTIKEYISLLSLKRKAFAYENELRIFAFGENLKDKDLFKVDLSCSPKDLISFITLPPYPPFTREDDRFPYYSAIQYIHNLGMRKKLEKYLNSKNVWQSHLYETKKTDSKVQKIKKIF